MLEAETEYGTLHADLAENSYVGLAGDSRSIGITFLDEVGAEDPHELDDGIVVQRYDREELALMVGEADAEEAAALESEERSHFDATIELAMQEEFVTGTVTFDDEESDVSGDWVVLPDERQWGCICAPPCVGPCCELWL